MVVHYHEGRIVVVCADQSAMRRIKANSQGRMNVFDTPNADDVRCIEDPSGHPAGNGRFHVGYDGVVSLGSCPCRTSHVGAVLIGQFPSQGSIFAPSMPELKEEKLGSTWQHARKLMHGRRSSLKPANGESPGCVSLRSRTSSARPSVVSFTWIEREREDRHRESLHFASQVDGSLWCIRNRAPLQLHVYGPVLLGVVSCKIPLQGPGISRRMWWE